jgi:hypothetical protein
LHVHIPYVEFPSDVEFAGHCAHSLVPPTEYCPASHPVQAADPRSDLNPAAQIWHVLSFVAFKKGDAYPAWQLMHVCWVPLCSLSYVPAAHGRHPSDLLNE